MRKIALTMLTIMMVFSLAITVGFAQPTNQEDCKATFKKFVGAKDYMNKQDLEDYLKSRGSDRGDEAESYFSEADKDKDGKLTQEEFCNRVLQPGISPGKK